MHSLRKPLAGAARGIDESAAAGQAHYSSDSCARSKSFWIPLPTLKDAIDLYSTVFIVHCVQDTILAYIDAVARQLARKPN